jgi:adenylate cyclase
MLPNNFNSKISPDSLLIDVPLSSVTAYYLRKLLQQNFDRLYLPTGSPIKSLADLLTASETTEIVRHLPWLSTEPQAGLTASSPQLQATVRQLEQLAMQHQTLNSQGARHQKSLKETETEIFRLLGLQLQESNPQTCILIVDDTPDVLRFLSTALTQQGYEVCSAIDGAIALNHAYNIQPDLILLDIMMSGIDGYEVCERLKADPLTQNIPVIFISAIGDGLDKVKAFGLGATDYITKPFQMEEVFVRIEHQLNLRDLQKRLEAQNARLQAEIRQRQQTEEQYRSLVEDAVIGIFRSTPDGQFTQVNTALVEILGYDSPSDLISGISNIAEYLYVQPQRRSQFISYLNQFNQVRDFESEVYRKDGTIIWIAEDARSIKDSNGNILHYEGMVKDITRRRQTNF